jgi:hypothetical protein
MLEEFRHGGNVRSQWFHELFKKRHLILTTYSAEHIFIQQSALTHGALAMPETWPPRADMLFSITRACVVM